MDGMDLSQVGAVRSFNRFYTRQIGILNEGFLDSPFSLSEVRVLYELAQRKKGTAAELCKDLGLDPGYLSRILRGFSKRGLVTKQVSETDGRQHDLFLTEQGHAAFALLNDRQSSQVETMLKDLSPIARRRLVEAMGAIQEVLGSPPERRVPYILRFHRPGDMGWVVQRHGVLYSEEYNWDERFEGLVAGVVADFIKNFNPRWDRCWIAEQEGENVGSIFLVRHSETIAKLRLFLVEPKARGLGIGKRLMDECIRFARQAGYLKITLWTNSVLLVARRMYEQVGFHLVHAEPHHSFGQDLIGETWELEL